MAIISCLKRAKTPKTEVVTFSRLDYWSMLDLFDRLPLHDLVRLNGLASWWSSYVTKVCRTKRDITVQCGDHDELDRSTTADHTQDQFNHFSLTSLTSLDHLLKVTNIHTHTSDRLAHLLPSITSLDIIIEENQSYDIADITYLIRQWSHQLVSLKFKCHSVYSSQSRILQTKLLLSLNAITSLRRLSINCKFWELSPMQDTIDLPVLSHLEYFYFETCYDDFDYLENSLVRYAGPNHNLKQIELPSLIWARRRSELLGEHQLLPKLTMIKPGVANQLTRDQWALFPNLTTVNLGSIRSRSKFMRHITGMQCLKLIRNLDMMLLITRDFEDNLDQVAINLPQLPSVTKLKLKILAFSPTNPYPSFKSLQLGTIFPNVESVCLGYAFTRNPSSCRVVKWMAKTWSKIIHRMFKLRVRRELAGVECTFKKPFLY